MGLAAQETYWGREKEKVRGARSPQCRSDPCRRSKEDWGGGVRACMQLGQAAKGKFKPQSCIGGGLRLHRRRGPASGLPLHSPGLGAAGRKPGSGVQLRPAVSNVT